MDSFGLLTRDKDQKLNKEQLNFIRRIIETSGLSWKEISRKYFISPSTLSRIKCISENEFKLHLIQKINFTQNDQMKEFRYKIWNYFQQNDVGFAVADVQNDLYYNFYIPWSLKTISNVMKKDSNLTFKKWTSRPNNITLNKIK